MITFIKSSHRMCFDLRYSTPVVGVRSVLQTIWADSIVSLLPTLLGFIPSLQLGLFLWLDVSWVVGSICRYTFIEYYISIEFNNSLIKRAIRCHSLPSTKSTFKRWYEMQDDMKWFHQCWIQFFNDFWTHPNTQINQRHDPKRLNYI